MDQLIAELYQRHQYWGERPLGHREIAYPRGRKSDPEIDLKGYIYTAVEQQQQEQEQPRVTIEAVDAEIARLEKELGGY